MGLTTEHRGRGQKVVVPGSGQFLNPTCIRTVTDGDFVYIYSAIFKYLTDLFYCAQDIGAVVCPFIYHYATHTDDGFRTVRHLGIMYGQIAPVLAGRAVITPIPPVWMQE